MSILDKNVSYFPSINATTNGTVVTLLSILQSDKHKEAILNLRASDAATQKVLKAKLPCFTVAGTFSRRSEDGIKERSGMAAVDLDGAESYDKIHLLKELKKIKSIAYSGLSCRGLRLWAIVPLLDPYKYEKHYERLIKSFSEMGLPMGDNCHKQISQPRYVSWNDKDTQFFNHEAELYSLLPPEKTYHHIKRPKPRYTIVDNPAGAFEWCKEQINKKHSFTEGKRHNYIVQLARYCNIKGVSYQDILSGCLGFAEADFPEEEITDIVYHINTTQKDSYNKLPYFEKKSYVRNPIPAKQVEEKGKEKISTSSFLGTNGKFYIPNPVQPSRIAVYNSLEAYNNRLHIPIYIDKAEAEKFFLKSIAVDIKSLQIID